MLRDEESGMYWFCPPKGLSEAVRKVLDWCGKENTDETTYVSNRFLRSLLVPPVKGSPSYYQRYSSQAIKSAFQNVGSEPRKRQEDTKDKLGIKEDKQSVRRYVLDRGHHESRRYQTVQEETQKTSNVEFMTVDQVAKCSISPVGPSRTTVGKD